MGHFHNDWKSKLGMVALCVAVLPYHAAILVRRLGRWAYRGLGPLACAVLHRGYYRQLGERQPVGDDKWRETWLCLFCRREWVKEFRG